MVIDTLCYVTKVEQELLDDPPEEDRVGNPLVPTVTGGTVLVTASSEEASVHFSVSVDDRVAVGDELHVRIDADPLLRPR
jgi:hypothetical protein